MRMAGYKKRGRVERRDANGFYEVRCRLPGSDTASEVLWLRPWQMAGAQVGDRVELVYDSTQSNGLWRVAKVEKTDWPGSVFAGL